MNRKVLLRLVIAASAPAILAGCGGLTNIISDQTSFAGNWTGTASGNNASGNMTLSIDANGNVTGTDSISSAGNTTNDSGTVSANGNFSITTKLNGTVVATITGTVLVVSNQMTGTGTMTVNGTGTNFSCTLATSTPLIRR